MKKLLAIVLSALMVASLGVTAFADNFAPSVEVKSAPEVIPVVDEEGNESPVIIVNKDGEKTDTSELIVVVTSISEAQSSEIPGVSESLTEAFVQIEAAEDLGKLSEGLGTEIENLLQSSDDPEVQEFKIEDLFVSDLFNVSLLDGTNVVEVEEGSTVTFYLQTNLRPGDFYGVLLSTGNDEWCLVTDTEVDEHGVVKITCAVLGAFAFISEKHELPTPIGPDSPTTGVSFDVTYALIALAGVALSVVFFVKAKKCAD